MDIARRARPWRRGVIAVLAAAALAGGAMITTGQPAYAADESISVNFSAVSGTPTYRASGWIYGMTEN
ncbi:beta-xylosidase, partial [Asanoa sp. NPDC049573]